MSKRGKCIPFPTNKTFEEDMAAIALEEMYLEGEFGLLTCVLAARIDEVVVEEYKKETGDVILDINENGKKTYYISVDKIRDLLYGLNMRSGTGYS